MTTHVSESDTQELVAELKRHVAGEVRFDKMTRILYSTDASIYQMEPIGVVIPRTADDVVAVVETAHRYGVPVLPRGGGTSLAGQTVGHAVVMDFSKYMRQVLEVNPEEGWVRVQPGIILDELNRHLEPYGLLFAPDPSTSNRGNVGGALGNNSCGAHSVLWGKTIDHVLEMEVVLSDGGRAHFGPVDGPALEARLRSDGLEGEIYRRLLEIGESYSEEVRKRFPKIQRRVSGYNLDELLGAPPFNMARFVVGSEGTLVTITEAKLRVVPRPRRRALAVVHFADLIESMEATVVALRHDPAAVEQVGSMILRQARQNLEYARMMDFVQGDPESILLVEMFGESEEELEARMDRLEQDLRRQGLGYAFVRMLRPEDQARVWAVRRAGLGLMMNTPGDAKPLPFVEDTAVAPERLPEYVRRFDEIVRAHGTTAGYYGHASVGCLHIRPLVNLKLEEGVEKLVAIARDVSDLVLEFGGAMSGEHGDGLVRSVWIEKMFGPRIYEAFRQVKRAFDPKGIMNPGKIVDPPPMTENLRISPAYRPAQLDTLFAFAREGGFAGAVEMCNGQGACRKVTAGTMCPSFMATRDEEHSTRGRANALRAAISGRLPLDSLTGERLYRVLDLCLECKACKAECPSNVDMARLKYEFLYRYRQANGYALKDRLVGHLPTLGRVGSLLAPLSNLPLRMAPFRALLERLAGIDRRRSLPAFASQTFVQWFRARGGSRPAEARGQVLLYPDTFTNYHHPEVGRAAVRVLEALGYQVVLPPVRCCGRTMMSAGLLDRAQANARYNVDLLYDYVQRGVAIVGLEPSCILNLRDDYVDLLGGDPKARAVAEASLLIEEFVLMALEQGAESPFRRPLPPVLFHGHCHQKALVGTGPALEVLRSLPEARVTEIQAGCCGMAGFFGMERDHYDISMRIGEMALFPAIRSQEGEFMVVAEGVSCRQQILDGTGRRAVHMAEALAQAL